MESPTLKAATTTTVTHGKMLRAEKTCECGTYHKYLPKVLDLTMIEGFRVTSPLPPMRFKRWAKLYDQQDSFVDTRTRFTHRGGSLPVIKREAESDPLPLVDPHP